MGDGDPTPPVYSNDSSGLKQKLSDWQKTQPSRDQRDAFLGAYSKSGFNFDPGPILGNKYSEFKGNQNFISGAVENYNSANQYEDYLRKQIDVVSGTEVTQAKTEALQQENATLAQRNQDRARAGAVQGFSRGTSRIISTSAAPIQSATSILASPLGVPGIYQPGGKTVLGA